LTEENQEVGKYAKLLIDNDFELLMFKEEQINLEDVFLQVTKGNLA
jgi:hypothetical protein